MTNLEARSAARARAIAALKAHADAGEPVYNADFTNWKDHANRAFEEATRAVQAVYLDGDRSIPSDSFLYYEMPHGLHNFPSRKFQGIVAKSTDSAMKTAALALIEEWKPLADAIKTVKANVIKGRRPSTSPRKTPERTLENTGTCAICGKNVKMDANGKLVAHGYTIRYGWQEGNCFGVGFAPVEVSNEALVAYREMLNSAIDRLMTSLAAMRADTVEVYYDRRHNKIERDNERFGQFRSMTISRTESDLRGARTALEHTTRSITDWKATSLPGEAA